MATAQLQKPKCKTQNWSSIFPEEQVTEVQSMLFVKKLLAVAVSSITYLRAIFPENAFGDRRLEDLKLKILREDNSCPGACQLQMILVGIYDNPDDPDASICSFFFKYIIGNPNRNTVIERYTFKFSYNGKNEFSVYRNDDKIIGSSTEEETKKATVKLLRRGKNLFINCYFKEGMRNFRLGIQNKHSAHWTLILLSQTLSPLPDDVMMTMKLLYYDDVTPADYQPPGFKACSADAFRFQADAMNIKVGSVATYIDEEIIPLEEKGNTSELKADKESLLKIPSTYPTKAADEETNIVDAFKHSEEAKSDNNPESLVKDETGKDEPMVSCPCGVNEDDGMMILCAACEAWQHAVCFAILESEQAPTSHICVSCSMKFETHRCTDTTLEKLSDSELMATCLWRRTLVSLLGMNRVTEKCLADKLGIEINIASKIIKRLVQEGYVKAKSKNKRLGKLVDKDRITDHAMMTYFRTDEEDRESVQLETTNENNEESLSSIVVKASKIDLEEKENPSSCKKSKSLEKKMMEIKEILQTKGNGRKRAVSTLNDEEFEISNSQDLSEVQDERKKRKKASAARDSLLV
eukprot:gene7678-8514_t